MTSDLLGGHFYLLMRQHAKQIDALWSETRKEGKNPLARVARRFGCGWAREIPCTAKRHNKSRSNRWFVYDLRHLRWGGNDARADHCRFERHSFYFRRLHRTKQVASSMQREWNIVRRISAATRLRARKKFRELTVKLSWDSWIHCSDGRRA